MAIRSALTAERRSTTLSAGLVLLAILVLGNATSIGAPIPVPMIVISVALAIAGFMAIVGAWTGRAGARWAGAGVAIATALYYLPGVFLASSPLSYIAGATVVVGLACAVLILLPASGRQS